jgi:putative GTP pyrophosphokinase
MSKFEKWVDEVQPRHARLTDTIVTIIENLLKRNDIEYLTVSGRTKTKESILEKIERKSYKDPAKQLTDLTGIRIVGYFESEIIKISNLINNSFNVDATNSLNQDEKLSVDQIGYRSIHFVCDIGPTRAALPEFEDLSNLSFEIQVRTVLQHAWAELAHDRNYKFTGKLPPDIERSLFLYAGMLEIADKGFSDISKKIDSYIEKVQADTSEGNLDLLLDSVTLPQFVDNWFKANDLELEETYSNSDFNELIAELKSVGIKKASELNNVIPDNYAKVCKEEAYTSNIWGHVRDWIIIHDWRKLLASNDITWVMGSEKYIFESFFDEEEYAEFKRSFEWENDESEDYDG